MDIFLLNVFSLLSRGINVIENNWIVFFISLRLGRGWDLEGKSKFLMYIG